MSKNIKSITLIELLVAMMAASIMVLSFYGFVNYGTRLVMNADRRAKVQNELSYCLEHMGKYVQMANGNMSDPANLKPAIVLESDGFGVRVDFNSSQTPSNLADDAWVSYSLVGNSLSVTCEGVCAAPFAAGVPESLSGKIITGFASNDVLQDPLPNPLLFGFYVKIDPDADPNNPAPNVVEIGLVGRYNPNKDIDPVTNPQVAMKTRLICNNSSIN